MLRFIGLSGFVLALMATTSFAQPPGGGGPPFGGGGRGGFGAMRMPASMLLMMPEVQKELKITDDEKSQLEDLRAEQQKNFQSVMSGFDFRSLQDMSEEERTKKMSELRTKGEALSKQVDDKVGKILDEPQMKRLKQLQIQMEGIGAFARSEVIAKLALTDDQKAKIQQIQENGRPQGRPAFDPDATPEERQAAFAKMAEKMQESRAKMLKDALAVLTDDQLMDWTELTGKEFKFPQGRMGFGGFGGPGGRGGPGGPGGPPRGNQ